jgi:mRNA degradation ribonuclease J1/J2
LEPIKSKTFNPKYNKPKQEKKPPVKISFLGGLNEIGKNITVVECCNDIILIDCGMAFPDGDMLGVDLVIPDFSYVEQNFERVKGIVLTHGHEDHIGGLPFLLAKVNVPIYGTPLTIGLIENKLREHSLSAPPKLVKKSAEEAKVAVRNTRRDVMEHFKKMKKDSLITEDEQRKAEDELQKLTDAKIKEIDKIAAEKEKEIMSV